MSEELHARLQRIEMDQAQIMGGQTALAREQRKMARCVAEFQAQYGESIKATAEDRAFVRGIKDRLVRRMADAIAWGLALILIACIAVGALYFLRPWLRYLFSSSA